MNIEISELRSLLNIMEAKNISILSLIEIINNNSGMLIDFASDFLITVDYGKSLDWLIVDGNLSWTHKLIKAKDFKVPAGIVGMRVDSAAKVFHFNRPIKSAQVIAIMEANGYRPANLLELLVFSKKCSGPPTIFPIFALGSVFVHDRNTSSAPCLAMHDGKRTVNVDLIDTSLPSRSRFLAIRKVPLSSSGS